jgi:hypothetical protein
LLHCLAFCFILILMLGILWHNVQLKLAASAM